ncbi:MAG: VOC family protein [Thermoplasmatota archaeon]
MHPTHPIQGLDAITVHLRNATPARTFYSYVLGLKELEWDEKAGRGVWEIPGGARLIAHVMQPGERGREPGTVSGIMFDVADVDASVAEIRKRGGTIVDEPWTAAWGPRFATVADPDGNEFLLIRRPK